MAERMGLMGELTHNYGTANGQNDQLSRLEKLVDDDATVLTEETYLGLGAIVKSQRPEPGFEYTLIGTTTDPDTGDIYVGLDRFGRIKDCRWMETMFSQS